MSKKTKTAKPRRRTPHVKNPLVALTLSEGENAHVNALATLFNTADVHSRRALLRHAATFAGTVPADVARELGNVKPNVTVPVPSRRLAGHADREANQPTRSYEQIARALVAKIDLYPDYTEIADRDAWDAMEAAFIEERVTDEASKAELRAYLADDDDERRAIQAALPDDLRSVFITLWDNRDTMLWIKEEIVYVIGIEVGLRLAGGAR